MQLFKLSIGWIVEGKTREGKEIVRLGKKEKRRGRENVEYKKRRASVEKKKIVK